MSSAEPFFISETFIFIQLNLNIVFCNLATDQQ